MPDFVVAAAIKELRPSVLPFMAMMVRHYTMVAIAQQSGQYFFFFLNSILFPKKGLDSRLTSL